MVATEHFSKSIRKNKKNTALLCELENKVQRLKETPHSIGKRLSGNLHGLYSTRIMSDFRLIFRIDEKQKTVYLYALASRRKNYSDL